MGFVPEKGCTRSIQGKNMKKQQVRHLTGLLSSIFAHAGHITKDEAKQICGIKDDSEFEAVYKRASIIAEKIMKSEGKKMDEFLEHFAKELDECIEHFDGEFFGNNNKT
jgi:hypothetical protein